MNQQNSVESIYADADDDCNNVLEDDGLFDDNTNNNFDFDENQNQNFHLNQGHNNFNDVQDDLLEDDLHEQRQSTEVTEENGDGQRSSKKRKTGNGKPRGRNKCKEIAKLKPEEKLEVTFFNNHAVGKNSRTFVRHLGIIIRDTNMCSDVFTNENLEAYRVHVLKHMNELWNNWRSDLLRYNVTKKQITLQAALKILPNGLEAEDWKWFIKEIYLKEQFKGGKTGNKPSFLEIYRETHKKDDKMVNDETTRKHDEIQMTMENNPSLSHAQVAEIVFKSKSRDRVVGYGGGITQKEIRGPQPSRVELEAKLISTVKHNEVLTTRLQTVEAENEELRGRIGSVEEQLSLFQETLSRLDIRMLNSQSHQDQQQGNDDSSNWIMASNEDTRP